MRGTKINMLCMYFRDKSSADRKKENTVADWVVINFHLIYLLSHSKICSICQIPTSKSNVLLSFSYFRFFIY